SNLSAPTTETTDIMVLHRQAGAVTAANGQNPGHPPPVEFLWQDEPGKRSFHLAPNIPAGGIRISPLTGKLSGLHIPASATRNHRGSAGPCRIIGGKDRMTQFASRFYPECRGHTGVYFQHSKNITPARYRCFIMGNRIMMHMAHHPAFIDEYHVEGDERVLHPESHRTGALKDKEHS